MATTTNYGWTTPDDTALVKDGAAAIRTLGSSVDTTTKNLNPSTTLGDIEYRSSTANTNTRLPIGTTGQVLTVAGGVPSWATTATPSSGMTKIATGTFTTVSTVDIDNVFSTSYATYFAYISVFGSVNDADLELQYRYAGPSTETGASYYSSFGRIDTANTESGHGVSAGTQARLHLNVGSSTREAKVAIWFNGVGQASADEPVYTGTNFDPYNTQAVGYIGGFTITDRIYTGIRLKPSSGTITGNYAIYGLAI
jgi:hypothetical protein